MSDYVVDGVRLTEAQAREVARQVRAQEAFPFKRGDVVVLLPSSRSMNAKPGQLATVTSDTPGWMSSSSEPLVYVAWDQRSGVEQCDGDYFVKDFRPATLADVEAFERKYAKPRFKVGDWIMLVPGLWPKARQVADVGEWSVIVGDLGYTPDELRHATPEEIAAAKRIEPKVGMLVQRRSDGSVWQWRTVDYSQGNLRWIKMSGGHDWERALPLDTDHYTILDSYTVQGVR